MLTSPVKMNITATSDTFNQPSTTSDTSNQPSTTTTTTIKKQQRSFFPKYLSSATLFHLELSDPLFRRQILAQLQILLQFLGMFESGEKEALAKHLDTINNSGGNGNYDRKKNASLAYLYTLGPDQFTLSKEQVKMITLTITTFIVIFSTPLLSKSTPPPPSFNRKTGFLLQLAAPQTRLTLIDQIVNIS